MNNPIARREFLKILGAGALTASAGTSTAYALQNTAKDNAQELARRISSLKDGTYGNLTVYTWPGGLKGAMFSGEVKATVLLKGYQTDDSALTVSNYKDLKTTYNKIVDKGIDGTVDQIPQGVSTEDAIKMYGSSLEALLGNVPK